MTLSDLAKYSVTQSVARSLCDSWASCQKNSRPASVLRQRKWDYGFCPGGGEWLTPLPSPWAASPRIRYGTG